MSFRVETAPNQYNDYQVFSAVRFNKLGQQFLSLINPNYEIVQDEEKLLSNENKAISNEDKVVSNGNADTSKETASSKNDNVPNETTASENDNTQNEIVSNDQSNQNDNKLIPSEENQNENEDKSYETVRNDNAYTSNKTTSNENEMVSNEHQTTSDTNLSSSNKNPTIPRHIIQRPSDLCRPRQEQSLYYIVDQNVLKQIEENFLPHRSILPYIPPSKDNKEHDEQLTTSILDWQISKQSKVSTRHLLSQIITIVQCRSTLSLNTSSFSTSQRTIRPVVRLFINYQKLQQLQMDNLLDIINEALLLELDTIKTLWDTKGEQITDPVDLLRCGRLYFVSRNEQINLDELIISENDLSTINRLEIIRQQLSQSAHFVEKPVSNEQSKAPSRKSTPFNPDESHSATVHAQAIAYNDPQTFPEVFLRHYTVEEVLGDGRFSAVYECRDKSTGIQLALKIIDKTRCKGYEYLIENELSILRRVKHPNIIKLVEEFQNELKYFLIFEYVSSGDLLASLTTMNKYSEHDVALMLSQIASALKYLHSLQIVHRDVKLENILMTSHPDQSVTLKLADFGLALCLTDQKSIVPKHKDNLCGTPMYLAPEVIQNRDYRIENDIWSLGVITFTLLSGVAPFDGDSESDIMSNVINKKIDFNLLPKIASECREALMLMLERNPSKRISAHELLQHSWIKFELQAQMEPVSERLSTRRKKRGTRKQPMLTFSSVDHGYSLKASNMGVLMDSVDEF